MSEDDYYEDTDRYLDDEDAEEDVELCQFTGDQCIADPMFCEECLIMLGEEEEIELEVMKRIDEEEAIE